MTRDLRRLNRIKINLTRRALIYQSIRAFFRNEGFTEVDTPVWVPSVAPEQHIRPCPADHGFLSTSPELHMKRLLAAGYGNIFQICHCFRKGESGQLHNPEFAMLEWYRLGADYARIIEDSERLVLAVARDLGTGESLEYQGCKISLTTPWPRITVEEAFRRWAGWNPLESHDPIRFDIDLVEKVMPCFPQDRPTVLTDYPAVYASLARLHPDDATVAERAEVFIGGLELANAYSELTDGEELRNRFRVENERLKAAGYAKLPLPRRFLGAMAHLPACGGIALGIDRLAMLFCDARSVDEVIAFPHELA